MPREHLVSFYSDLPDYFCEDWDGEDAIDLSSRLMRWAIDGGADDRPELYFILLESLAIFQNCVRHSSAENSEEMITLYDDIMDRVQHIIMRVVEDYGGDPGRGKAYEAAYEAINAAGLRPDTASPRGGKRSS